jgi:HD-GYP domain-containing protein (c-di-GMP phosphodiesterase class II)
MHTNWSIGHEGFGFTASDVSLAVNARSLAVDYLRASCERESDLLAAELIIGELLANVVQHAPGPVAMHIRRRGGEALLEVCDEGAGYPINLALPDDFAESSRGLFIIAALGRELRTFRRGNQTVTSIVLPVQLVQPASFDAGAHIDSLLALMSLRYPRVVAHMEDVAFLAKRLAQTLRLPADVVSRCYLAARVHDIGLNGVDDATLGSSTTLASSERALVDRHTIAAHAVLTGSPLLRDLALIVRSHHERFDGHGYPDGLIGDDIPIESRIIAVADAFLTMTVQQTYRPVTAPSYAIRELLNQRDAQFDGAVVDACCTALGYSDVEDESEIA